MKAKYKNLSKNVILFTICSFGQRFLSFFLVPLYTNFLTTEEYGIIDLILNFSSLLVPIITIAVSSSVMRFTMQDPSDSRYLAHGFRTDIFGFFVLCVLGIGFYVFPVSVLGREYYIWVVALGTGYMLNNLFTDYLRGIGRVSLMVGASITNTLINLTLNIIFIVVFHLGVSGYIMGNCMGIFSGLLVVQIRENVFGKAVKGGKLTKEERKEVYSYSIPLIFSSLAWWINSSLDRIFITGMRGASENGIYSMSYKIPNILAAFEQVFSQAWLLSSVMEYDKNDQDGYFTNMYEIYNAGMTMICAGIILINIPISKLLYAKDFFEAWRCVPILLLATLFLSLKTFMSGIFTAVKNTKFSAFISALSAVINTILNAILISYMGMLGAGIATCASYFCIYLLSLLAARRYIDLKLNFFKEEVAHALVLLQVICATTNNHLYAVQALIVFILILMFYRRYIRLFSALGRQLKLKRPPLNNV